MEHRSEGTVGVSTDDPGRAYADAYAMYEVRYPEATVRSTSRLRVESDAEAYRVRLEVEAAEDGVVRWSGRWERRIGRNRQ
jgi:hypothetical protein